MTRIVQTNPNVKMEIRCDLSRNLIEDLRKDELDIAVGLYPGSDQQFLYRSWLEKPVWVSAKGLTYSGEDELPLVAHPFGCVYRDRMTEALKHAKRRWRVAFSSPGIASVQQAILDGIGVSCLTGPTMIDGLHPLPTNMDFPALDPIHIGLFYRQTRLAQGGHEVVNKIEATLDEAFA